jgi:hypothetical protein
MTRRAEMRTRRQWDCEESIVTAPAIVDINVVACVPELAVDEVIQSPVMVSVISKDAYKPAPVAAMEPAHADRDVVVPVPVEELNRGAVPEIDIASQRDEAAAMIVAANEITVIASAIEIREPSPAVSPAADSGATPGSISTEMLAGITPVDAPPAPAKKVRRRSNAAGKTKKPRTKSGTEMDEAGTSQETDGQNRPPGYGPNDGSYAHSPPKTTQLAERELRDAGTGRGLKPRPLTSDEVTGAASSSVRL